MLDAPVQRQQTEAAPRLVGLLLHAAALVVLLVPVLGLHAVLALDLLEVHALAGLQDLRARLLADVLELRHELRRRLGPGRAAIAGGPPTHQTSVVLLA